MTATEALKHTAAMLLLTAFSMQSAGAPAATETAPHADDDTAKPWTFWYWMYGAVSREGIHADLQAMKDVGLGGCYLMPIRGTEETPATLPPLPGEAAQQLTPQFWTMVDYALQQADSLCLKMGIHICDGFALAGGPWTSPEESMQQVVWSDTVVSLDPAFCNAPTRLDAGGADSALTARLMPPPPAAPGQYYEDIGVFACPLWGDGTAPPHPAVSGTIARNDNGTFRSKEPGYIEYTYERPVTVRSVTVYPSGNNIQSQRLLVQAYMDSEGWVTLRQLTPPGQGWQNTPPQNPASRASFSHSNHYTYSLPETCSHRFRFLWTPEGTPPGAEDMDAAKWSPVLKLNDVTLSAEPAIDQYESKNGSVWRIPGEGMKAAGGGPHARFRILRIGHTTTGQQNATAGGARGLECDKFSREAVGRQLDGWFARFMERPHHDIIKYMHVDSWECGSQNWSRNFPAEFRRRRGYDLLPFMPVFAGVPIDGTAEALALGLSSDSVLHDIRLTINDLVQDVFFATVRERAHSYGLLLSCESVAPTMVCDGMEHFRQADIPMGEFWLGSPTHDKPNDMLDAISGAHVYGKRIVQAEGFTEVRGVWDETPAGLKTLLDRNLAMGMNRLFFHVFTHNPWTDRKPGMTLDGIGLFFQRDQTWFPEAKSFVDYVYRCQRWLQRGRPVADIAVFTGDGMPRRAWRPEQLADMLPGLIGHDRVAHEMARRANKGAPMEESPAGVRHNANIADPANWTNPLNGYAYDSMNPDALHSIRHTYSALVIPEGTEVSAESRAAIDSMRRRGATIIDRPWQQPTLCGLAPDVKLPAGIAFCHRRDGGQDIYFLANQKDSVQKFYATFRVHGKEAIVYDPMADRYTPPVGGVLAADTLTVVRMTMQPRQSLFVLFGAKGVTAGAAPGRHAAQEADTPQEKLQCRMGRHWQLHFSETGRKMKSDTLFSWTCHSDADVRYYSGHVRYTNTLHCRFSNPSDPLTLSLGDVRDIAHVWLNGHDMGTLWLPPYKADVTGHLRQGRNTLEIEVVNTWHNALLGSDKGTPPFDGIWTNAGYRTKGGQLLPAGLLGPVTLHTERPEAPLASAAPLSPPMTDFRADTISDDVFMRMAGRSYPEGCTVKRSDLRLLHVLHTDADGETHKGEMVCNKAVAEDLLEIFRRLYEARYPIEKMTLIDDYDADDERSMADDNTSGFCFRKVDGSKKMSKHALGMAVDINPLYNPCVRTRKDGTVTVQPQKGLPYADRKKKSPYSIVKGDLCHRLFTQYGFTWGGAWDSVKDYQHFER